MTIQALRREWRLAGEYCAERGCRTRKRLGSDRCWDHRRKPTHWCSLVSDRRLVLL